MHGNILQYGSAHNHICMTKLQISHDRYKLIRFTYLPTYQINLQRYVFSLENPHYCLNTTGTNYVTEGSKNFKLKRGRLCKCLRV